MTYVLLAAVPAVSGTTQGLFWFAVAATVAGLTLLLRGTVYQLGGVAVSRRAAAVVALILGVLLFVAAGIRLVLLA